MEYFCLEIFRGTEYFRIKILWGLNIYHISISFSIIFRIFAAK